MTQFAPRGATGKEIVTVQIVTSELVSVTVDAGEH
jgi:hypothetical protein